MRLAQLARKIGVKPSEIAAFLASKAVHIEDSSNAKVNDDHVPLILEHFAPGLLQADELEMKDQVEVEREIIEEKEIPEPKVVEEQVSKPEAEVIAAQQIIKAPKVELPGLKVVGKIDLPEPNKKEEEKPDLIEGEIIDPAEETPRRPARPENRKKVLSSREQDRRPRKNPIALQREREEHEAKRKRQEKEEKEKEKRTQRYLKKVSSKTPPPRPMKANKHEDEYEDFEEEMVKPKSIVGKILSWFVSE